MEKKKFTLPKMADVRAAKGTSGYNAISTFSGCGGSSLGLTLAGFEVRAASEFIDEAVKTYQANNPGTPVVNLDIRKVTGETLLAAANLKPGELDVFEGSPPCSAFSMAGNREAGWGKKKAYSDSAVQVVDDLFFEWIRIAGQLKPRVLVAENVPGLARGKAVGYLKEILKEIRKIGYTPEARIIDPTWLGVPQTRNRLIIIAVRNDLVEAGIKPAFPKPGKYRYTLRDAIGLPENPKATSPILDPETKEDISFLKNAIGPEWKKTRVGEASEKYFQLVRCHPDKPVGTLTATAGSIGAASITHPTEPRKFNVKEARALCSFPEDFILTGSYRQRIERLGRAVPPLLYKAVGEAIIGILKQADEKGITK